MSFSKQDPTVELQGVATDLARRMSWLIGRLNNEKQQEVEIQDMKKQIQIFNTNLDSLSDTSTRWKNLVDTLYTEFEVNQEQLARSKADLQADQQQLAASKTSFDKECVELEASRHQLTKAQEQCNESIRELGASREKFEEQQSAVLKTQMTGDSIKQSLASLSSSNKDVLGKLTEWSPEKRFSEEMEQLRQAYEEAQKELSEKTDELSTAKGEISSTQAELADKQTELTNTRSDLSNVQAELSNTKTVLLNTQRELSDVKDDLSNSRTELSNTKAELTKIRTELFNTNTWLSNTRDELTNTRAASRRARTELINTQASLQETKTKLREGQTTHKKAMEDEHKRLSATRRQLDISASGLNNQINERLTLENELTRLKIEHEGANESIAEINAHLSQAIEDFNNVKMERDQVKKRLEEKESLLTAKENCLRCNDEKIKELETSIETALVRKRGRDVETQTSKEEPIFGIPRKRTRISKEDLVDANQQKLQWFQQVEDMKSFFYHFRPICSEDANISLNHVLVEFMRASDDENLQDLLADFLACAPSDTWHCFLQIADAKLGNPDVIIEDDKCPVHKDRCFQVCNASGKEGYGAIYCRLREYK